MSTNTKKSIVKKSESIRTFLQQRMAELNLKPADIVKDAIERDVKIDNASFSRYMKHGDVKGSLSEEAIVWLCCRWGIKIQLIVGSLVITDGKLKVTLPPYNEQKALEKLNTVFGK